MNYKWIGAILVMTGCSYTGFSIASAHKREEEELRELLAMLQYMENELKYRLTPLPELCMLAAKETTGILSRVMKELIQELECQLAPDARSCMAAVLNRNNNLAVSLRKLLLQLGHTLGRFDLSGQLQGIQSVQKSCEAELHKHCQNRDIRLRSYQTLGICTGAALAILLV